MLLTHTGDSTFVKWVSGTCYLCMNLRGFQSIHSLSNCTAIITQVAMPQVPLDWKLQARVLTQGASSCLYTRPGIQGASKQPMIVTPRGPCTSDVVTN